MNKQLTKIQSEDDSCNRFQDQVVGLFNPVLRTLPQGIGSRPSVTGSTAGNAALQNLLEKLDTMGLVKDETT